jgi:shikimate dehydrogenase
VRTGNHFVGVLGWPLRHTLSPAIQNAAFRSLGLDWVYFAWPVPPEDLPAAIGGLRALGAMGANVTMPHKEPVVELLDEISSDVEMVGAVNTIQRFGNDLIGHNTDVEGFKEFLTGDSGADPAGASAIVVGSGGAARAVVKALDDLGTARITIVARSPDKASPVAEIAASRTDIRTVQDGIALVEDADFVINATPLGSEGEDPLPGASFRPGQLVVDLVYSAPATPLMERARAGGAIASNGLGMLVHQAAASFRIWTGKDPSLETMSAAALRTITSP